MKNSNELENIAITQAAALMAAAARTAPKTRGIDNVEIIDIDDEPMKKKLIATMKSISKAENRPSFERDANSIAGCHSMLVVGVKSNPAGLNCGMCGYGTCEGLKKTKGICAYNSIDLGIAITSAVSLASKLCIDNRIMYSIGRAALDLGLFDKSTKQALGVPLSVTGKSPFFDRKIK